MLHRNANHRWHARLLVPARAYERAARATRSRRRATVGQAKPPRAAPHRTRGDIWWHARRNLAQPERLVDGDMKRRTSGGSTGVQAVLALSRDSARPSDGQAHARIGRAPVV